VDIIFGRYGPLTRPNTDNIALNRRNRVTRKTSTKNKRTNKHSNRGRKSASDLSDQELLAPARAQLRNKPKRDSSGYFRASFPGECPRCEKRIAVGQEIHRVADFDGYVHFGCTPKPVVLEGGKAHIVTVRRFSTTPNVCRDCNTEHRGPAGDRAS
jgi:hypothetical protein